MPDFKVDDKVVVVAENDGVPLGVTGTIVYMTRSGKYIRVFLDQEDKTGPNCYYNYYDSNGTGWSFPAECIELYYATPKRVVDRELDKLYADL